MGKIIGIIAAFALLMTACGGNQNASDSTLKGEVKISGAYALYPLATEWADEFQKLHPGVKVNVQAGGAGKGITDAMSQAVDFGMVSRSLFKSEIDKGAIGFPVAKDAVVATVNANNPMIKEILAHGISVDDAKKIWITGEAKVWGDILGNGDQTPIKAYTRSDACGAASTWAEWFGKKQEDLLGTKVHSDPGLVTAVQKDVNGVGINNIGYAYDAKSHKPVKDILVLPIDCNGDGKISSDEYFYDTKNDVTKAIADDKFPSPPARDLLLVSKGLPINEAAIEFLKYVLSKEGQQKNIDEGYITMPDDKIQKSLELLK
ncbi:MAG: extracellular solute-binding protein [Bacteroidales bacterium]|nr:extracellular solute-binding protein [Bacteroidales bacterium]